VAAQHRGQALERVPGDGLAAVDREVPERLDQMALASAAGAADAERLGAIDPFQRAQRVLGRFRDRRGVLVPGVERLAGSPDARRRIWIVAWSRPAASSASRTLRTSAGSQRCEAAVAITSGAALRT
jgi:hypothetical protein